MTTNGATNGSSESELTDADARSPFDKFVQEMDLDIPSNQYVGFEQIMGTLMWAAMERQLRLYAVTNQLDTTSLERIFSAGCVPMEWDAPYQHNAKISFIWPAEYTVLSVSGDEALCSLYHDDDRACLHEPGTADLFVELMIDYHLPFEFVQSLDSDEGIEKTARQVRRTFAELVDHDNIVNVEATAVFSGNRLALTGIKAHHHWTLEEELRSLPLLSDVLLSICEEMRKVLLRFKREFPVRNE